MILSSLDIILMRKDPPFDLDYIYSTYMLEIAHQKGVVVVNNKVYETVTKNFLQHNFHNAVLQFW